MMAAEKTTLKSIKSSPKMAEQHYRPSDFLSQSEIDELREANASGKKRKRPYDDIDAFEAEILARFGWQTYQAYLSGEADVEQLAKYIAAERARDAQNRYNLECIIISAAAGANRPQKHGGTPKSLKKAIDIVKTEYKRAKGVQ